MDACEFRLLCFGAALIFFHSSEFLLALFFDRVAGVGSLLVSVPYLVALALGLVEHTVESWLLPNYKTQAIITDVGLGLVVVGEFIRKLAILTAQRNFTHDIKVEHKADHHLVTHGIYRFVRHPSYLGFFLFAVGTQILLCNPLCTVGYIIVLWRFFEDRIEYPQSIYFRYEEYFLVEFFGQRYKDYSERVPSGIPFVK